MNIKELESLLIREVNYALSIVKGRALYQQASDDVRLRINQEIESEIVRYCMCTRYFNSTLQRGIY